MAEWIKIRGPAKVLSLSDDTQLTAQEVLATLDGARPDLYGEVLSDYIEETERTALQISGGILTLRFINAALLPTSLIFCFIAEA